MSDRENDPKRKPEIQPDLQPNPLPPITFEIKPEPNKNEPGPKIPEMQPHPKPELLPGIIP